MKLEDDSDRYDAPEVREAVQHMVEYAWLWSLYDDAARMLRSYGLRPEDFLTTPDKIRHGQ